MLWSWISIIIVLRLFRTAFNSLINIKCTEGFFVYVSMTKKKNSWKNYKEWIFISIQDVCYIFLMWYGSFLEIHFYYMKVNKPWAEDSRCQQNVLDLREGLKRSPLPASFPTGRKLRPLGTHAHHWPTTLYLKIKWPITMTLDNLLGIRNVWRNSENMKPVKLEPDFIM